MATFKKDDLIALLDGESETLEKVRDAITGRSRWSLQHELVFREKASGQFFRVGYSEGATEQQDESPFEYDGDNIEAEGVCAVERMVTVYEPT